MTWSALKATAVDFEPHRKYVQSLVNRGEVYPDVSAVIDVELSAAKDRLYTDLQTALGIDPTDATDTTIDDLADAQTRWLQQTLAIKQLAILFQRQDGGEGSQTHSNWRYYDAEYDARKKSFANLTVTKRGATVRSIRVGL